MRATGTQQPRVFGAGNALISVSLKTGDSADFCTGLLNFYIQVSNDNGNRANGSILLPFETRLASAVEGRTESSEDQSIFAIIDTKNRVPSTVDGDTALQSAGSYHSWEETDNNPDEYNTGMPAAAKPLAYAADPSALADPLMAAFSDPLMADDPVMAAVTDPSAEENSAMTAAADPLSAPDPIPAAVTDPTEVLTPPAVVDTSLSGDLPAALIPSAAQDPSVPADPPAPTDPSMPTDPSVPADPSVPSDPTASEDPSGKSDAVLTSPDTPPENGDTALTSQDTSAENGDTALTSPDTPAENGDASAADKGEGLNTGSTVTEPRADVPADGSDTGAADPDTSGN